MADDAPESRDQAAYVEAFEMLRVEIVDRLNHPSGLSASDLHSLAQALTETMSGHQGAIAFDHSVKLFSERTNDD